MATELFGLPEIPSRFIYLCWIDAGGQMNQSLSREELSGPLEIETVGWLIRETEDHLSICQDYIRETNLFRDVQHIPKALIRSRKELKPE